MYFRLYQLRVLGFADSNGVLEQLLRLLSVRGNLRCTGASFWTRVTTRFTTRMHRLARHAQPLEPTRPLAVHVVRCTQVHPCSMEATNMYALPSLARSVGPAPLHHLLSKVWWNFGRTLEVCHNLHHFFKLHLCCVLDSLGSTGPAMGSRQQHGQQQAAAGVHVPALQPAGA
jgi:hypothetical protein